MDIRWYQKIWIGVIIVVLSGAMLVYSFALSSNARVEQSDISKDASKEEELKQYGNTPEDLRPYRRFVRKPYKQFFVSPPDTPLQFLGPGREKPEPNVKTVKIGLIAPLERTHEDYMGRSMLQGTEMAIDETNAAGGYKGKPFELIVRNDSGLWGASANEIVAFS